MRCEMPNTVCRLAVVRWQMPTSQNELTELGSRAPAEGSAVGMSQGVCVRLCASRRNVVPGIGSAGSLVVLA